MSGPVHWWFGLAETQWYTLECCGYSASLSATQKQKQISLRWSGGRTETFGLLPIAQLFGLPLGKLRVGRLKSPSLETWTWEQAMAADWSLEHSCGCPREGVVFYWDWLEPSCWFLPQRLPQQGTLVTPAKNWPICLMIGETMSHRVLPLLLLADWLCQTFEPLSGLSGLPHYYQYFFKLLVSCFQPHHFSLWN